MTQAATHWIPKGVAFEDTDVFPDKDAIEAAKNYMQMNEDEGGANDDARNDLMQHGTALVEMRGVYETTELLPADVEPFDGYEPGCTYWKNTTERKTIKLTLTATEVP